MSRRQNPPESAQPVGNDGAMHAPSALRNQQAILDALLPRLPRNGDVMELASGTGQHIAALAAHRPDLRFHPTELDPMRRISIDVHCKGLPNVSRAGNIDAVQPGWAAEAASNMVLVVNLLHLISDGELAVLLDEAQRALAPGGLLAIYGPFLREGVPTSVGDREFDAELRARDPVIGYKDIDQVTAVLSVLGLAVEVLPMPANNLMILAHARRVAGL